MTTDQTCRTCRHAEWTRTVRGHINSLRPGKCLYPESAIRLPLVMRLAWPGRSAIWAKDTDSCPTWERL